MSVTIPNPAEVAQPGEADPTRPTAVIYLRVSSSGQVNKAFDPEGYSIPGQREACNCYAESLGARVVEEYVEPGKSGTTTNRPALQRMLLDLAALRPTYVIFYDLSRVARDDFDALFLLRQIEAHGCKLESTLERVDDTPAGKLLYTIMAGVNAFRSRGDAEKVRMGLARKHESGGTIGRAPIGYMNTRERIEGREVRTVGIDPERGPLVQLAFDLYATGDYTLTQLHAKLDDAGLRTPLTPKRAPAPLSRSNIHRLLQDDYYVGIVTYKGVKREGRHEPLIDRRTFDRVQEILRAHALSGDRTRKHTHYLKGSVFCDHCGARLTYGHYRGNGGTYEYFRCLKRQRGERCEARHMAAGQVEVAVERYYVGVRLLPHQREAIRRAVRSYVTSLAENAGEEAARHARRLRQLQEEQQKLLHLYYRGMVDEDVLAAEQERLARERAEAEQWSAAASCDAELIEEALEEALALLTDVEIAYAKASEHGRRLLNQAIFSRLRVLDEWIADAELEPWVGALHDLARSASPSEGRDFRVPAGVLATAGIPVLAGENNRGPRFPGGHGLHLNKMVRSSGLEPPRGKPPTRPSTLRVYQFRHERERGR